MSDEPTSAVIERAVAGDSDALRTLLERHGQQVWTQINGDIAQQWRSVLDPDDVMQVTYVEVFLQIRKLTARDEAGFVAWMRRIAQNNLRDAVKELGRKKRPQPGMRVSSPAGTDSYVTLVEHLGAISSTPSRHVAAKEVVRVIDSALNQLPKDYATVIRLYDLESKPISEVAQSMGRSTGAIHMLRARAHDQLRDRLGDGGDFFSFPG